MKKISEICKRINVEYKNVPDNLEIEGVAINSKKVNKNYAFFVTRGNEKYIGEALNNGAVVIFTERDIANCPIIIVKDVRKSMSYVVSDFYDNPENKLQIIGVVGTNGKTTVTHILSAIFENVSKTTVIGTLGAYVDKEFFPTELTSPDTVDFFNLLYKSVEKKVKYVFCEVSAHAIYFEKFYGIKFNVCIFTNLSHDHLDFFENMENYRRAKIDFFNENNVKIGVVNVDDNAGVEIINNGLICSVSYGIEAPSDVFAININTQNGVNFIANAFDDVIYVSSNLYGDFNVYNLLASITVAKLYGIKSSTIARAINNLKPIEGRFNVINRYPLVIVDYAHTPDGIEKAILCAKQMCLGKVVAVFGCGGNRDREKRAVMAKIGCAIADVCVFTEDNSRYEEIEDIISDMLKGVEDKDNYIVIKDRRDAVEFAIRAVENKDCVIICGKGGENYIEKGGKKIPYSDNSVCNMVFGRR